MNGIPSTKMGGFPAPNKRYGKIQPKYRYYRFVIPQGDRMYPNNLYIEETWEPTQVHHLYFAEYTGGPNWFEATDITLSSNYWLDAMLATWLTARRASPQGSSSDAILLCGVQSSPYIEIDCKQEMRFQVMSACLQNPIAGWILLGSNNRKTWNVIIDVHPDDIAQNYPWYTNGPLWYAYDLFSFKPPVHTATEFLYWAVTPGMNYHRLTGGDRDYCPIYEVEFNDTPGGTDLCTGGSASSAASPSSRSYVALFNDNTADSVSCYTSSAFAYLFLAPVEPEELTILMGDTPNQVFVDWWVLKADNPYVWYFHKYIETPYGTWDNPGTNTEEAFPL